MCFQYSFLERAAKFKKSLQHCKSQMAGFVEHATNKAFCNIQLVETSFLNITISELMQGQNCLEVNISLYIGTFWKFVFYQCLKFPSAICYWNYLLMIKSHPTALPNLCTDKVYIVRKWFAIKFFHQQPESRERQTSESVFASTSESTSHLE